MTWRRRVHSLARELGGAETELQRTKALDATWEWNAPSQNGSVEVQGDLRAAWQKFTEHYREFALALGRWYTLGIESASW